MYKKDKCADRIKEKNDLKNEGCLYLKEAE
jgi:hypothetical protein